MIIWQHFCCKGRTKELSKLPGSSNVSGGALKPPSTPVPPQMNRTNSKSMSPLTLSAAVSASRRSLLSFYLPLALPASLRTSLAETYILPLLNNYYLSVVDRFVWILSYFPTQLPWKNRQTAKKLVYLILFCISLSFFVTLQMQKRQKEWYKLCHQTFSHLL